MRRRSTSRIGWSELAPEVTGVSHKNDELQIQAILEADLDRALALHEEYVGVGADRFWRWLEKRRSWFRGAYLSGELVGICFGNESEPGHVTVQSIAVKVGHWRRGIGSQLIRDFEDQVFGDGMERIGLGSAPDVPTESFYIKNGFKPTEIMVRVGAETPLELDGHLEFRPDRVVSNEEGRRFYFHVDTYRPADRITLKEAYSASQAIYIFE
jgi:GNAT superfamily N-acetyltransferase